MQQYLSDLYAQMNAWTVVGFLGQFMFTMRFLWQWLASEKAKRSIIPHAFWYFSLSGGFILTLYALHKKDPVFILGQGMGLFIYLRNIYFITRKDPRENP